MGLYVYAPTLQQGTKKLIDALQAKRLIRHDGMHFLLRGMPIQFNPTDAIVCWGAHVPAIPGVPFLNASIAYPSQLLLNTVGSKRLTNLDYSVLLATPQSAKVYKESLFPRWPHQRPPWNVVSIPELDGYANTWMRFDQPETIAVFNGEIIAGRTDSSEWAIKVTDHLGLNFCVLTVGRSGMTNILIKVITGPVLNSEDVKLWAEKISGWAKQVGEFNAKRG